MTETLAQLATAAKKNNRYFGDGEYAYLRQMETRITSIPQRVGLLVKLGHSCMNLGQEQEAINSYAQAFRLLTNNEKSFPADQLNKMKYTASFWLGMAYLRLAETQNCCQRNTPDSCIVPIQGQGIHEKKESSQQAINWFQYTLKTAPQDSADYLRAKWLMNLAYMTIGQYPGQVPREHLIPPEFFRSQQKSFPQFKNISKKLGIDTFSCAGGAIADDFDNDGDLDIVTSDYDPSGQLRMFRNDGPKGFTDVTSAANLDGITGGLNLNQADFNNDGFVDIFVMRGGWFGEAGQHPNSLLRNNGDGTFDDVTYMAGLGDRDRPSQTSSWADYDLDGDLDLLIGNEPCGKLFSPCQLYRNNGDETFTYVSEKAGVEVEAFTKAVVWGDFNNDRWPDFYISNFDGPNYLFKNNGDGTFTDVAQKWGVSLPKVSFPCWFWDYDNDGKLDLFVSSYASKLADYAEFAATGKFSSSTARVYRNLGDRFGDQAKSLGVASPNSPMGSNFGDINNDGFLDFYLGTGWPQFEQLMPNLMFVNQGGKKFANVTMASRVGHLQKGHGVVFADLDHDGDLDLLMEMGGAFPGDRFYNALFENPGFSNNFLAIQLQGVKSSRSAIGARIRVDFEENGKSRSVHRRVNSGGTFGANPLRQHIGIGKATRVKKIEIFWPKTNKTQVLENLDANQLIQVKEGSQDYKSLKYEKIEWKK